MSDNEMLIVILIILIFIVYKFLCLMYRLVRKGLSFLINSIFASFRKKKNKKEYSIDQNDFTRIALKTAYRHPRIDEANVVENSLLITIMSQTGFSKSHAKITFVLNGSDIGAYKISRDNCDTTVPERIADKIQIEIQKQAYPTN